MHKLPPNETQKGNHYIVFKIDIPKNLTKEEQALYEALAKVEDPIDPRTVRVSDDETDESSRGNGRKSNRSGSNKKDRDEENEAFYNIFGNMFRK